jgi:hypothetical protein
MAAASPGAGAQQPANQISPHQKGGGLPGALKIIKARVAHPNSGHQGDTKLNIGIRID